MSDAEIGKRLTWSIWFGWHAGMLAAGVIILGHAFAGTSLSDVAWVLLIVGLPTSLALMGALVLIAGALWALAARP